MKESQPNYARLFLFTDKAKNIAETAVGLVTAPLFFATTVRLFAFGSEITEFNPNAENNGAHRAVLDLKHSEIRIPSGTTITARVHGCSLLVRDWKARKAYTRKPHATADIGGTLQPIVKASKPRASMVGGESYSVSRDKIVVELPTSTLVESYLIEIEHS